MTKYVCHICIYVYIYIYKYNNYTNKYNIFLQKKKDAAPHVWKTMVIECTIKMQCEFWIMRSITLAVLCRVCFFLQVKKIKTIGCQSKHLCFFVALLSSRPPQTMGEIPGDFDSQAEMSVRVWKYCFNGQSTLTLEFRSQYRIWSFGTIETWYISRMVNNKILNKTWNTI